MSDQHVTSPHNTDTTSSRHVMRIKKKGQLGDYELTQCQILKTNNIKIVWHTVRRIIIEILGLTRLDQQN